MTADKPAIECRNTRFLAFEFGLGFKVRKLLAHVYGRRRFRAVWRLRLVRSSRLTYV